MKLNFSSVRGFKKIPKLSRKRTNEDRGNQTLHLIARELFKSFIQLITLTFTFNEQLHNRCLHKPRIYPGLGAYFLTVNK